MAKTTIEINGKLYDVHTGVLVGDSLAKNQHNPPTAAKRSAVGKRNTGVIDGFVRPNAPMHLKKTTTQSPALANSSVYTVKPIRSLTQKSSLAKITPAKAHKVQHSQTLMRKTVHKPTASLKPALKVQTNAELAATPKPGTAVPALKKSVQQIDNQRLARAVTVPQSQRIQRFVKQSLHQQSANQVALAETAPVASLSQPLTHSRGQYAHQVRPRPLASSTTTSTAPQHETIFEAAIANARSHEQPLVKTRSRFSKGLLWTGIVTGLVLFLAGIAIYLNLTNIQLKIASMQAGFHVQLPAYEPVGYNLSGGIHNANGVVSYSFQSGDSNYSIDQQASNWDSQTLLDNVVALASNSHKTYQANGRTIYIYGSKASWVNNGVLYSLKTSGDLTNQQIVSIADSI